MDSLRYKKNMDKSPWNKPGHIHRPFPAELAFARAVKLRKICNTDIYWHANCVLISACLFCGNIFIRLHNAMSACPELLQWHAATTGHSPTSWQSCSVKSFWDNLPLDWKIQSRLWMAYSLCTRWTAEGPCFFNTHSQWAPSFWRVFF